MRKFVNAVATACVARYVVMYREADYELGLRDKGSVEHLQGIGITLTLRT